MLDDTQPACNERQQMACQTQFGRLAASLELVREDVKDARHDIGKLAGRLTEVQVMLREHVNHTPPSTGKKAWAALLTAATAIGTAIGAAWRGNAK